MPAPIRNTTPRSPEKHKGRTHYGTGSAPKGGHTAPAPVVKTPVRVVTPSGKSYVPKATTKRLKKINAVQRDRAAAAFRVSHLGDPNTNLSLWENKIKAAAHAAAKGAEIPKDIRQHGADVIPHELWKAYPKATPKLAAAATHLMDDNVPVDVAGSLAIDVLSGGVASAGAKLGARALEAAGAEAAASTAADEAATQAAKAAERVLPQASKAKVAVKDVIERAKTAPERAAKSVKSAPARTLTKVKTAPARAAISASTSEGRKVAAKAAAEKALEHRASTAIVAATAAKKAGINAPGINEVGNFGQGLVDAVHHHPGETALTTLRSVPAAITGPAALLGAAGSSITHGTPDPLIKTAKEQAQGVGKIVTDATSSDPKVAERAFTKEGAGALLTPLPAVTRTKLFKAAREDVRGAASAVRRGAAEKSDALNRKVRHAPKGHEEHLTKKGAHRDARKEVVITKARADRPAEVAAAGHTKRIRNAIARAPKGSDAILQTVAEFGIRDKAHADHIRANGPGDKQLLHALDYIDAHPHIFEDKHFKNALKALDSSSRNLPAGKLGLGERARYLPQGDAHGILPPEHRVPIAAREHTDAVTRDEAFTHLDNQRKLEKVARRAARDKRMQAKVATGAERKTLLEEAAHAKRDADLAKKDGDALAAALKDYTHPKNNIDRSALKPYDKKLLDEYTAEVRAKNAEHGLAEPIYTAHRAADGHHGEGLGMSFPVAPGRVEHMRNSSATGKTLAATDNLDRSLPGLVEHSVRMPRMRAAGKEFVRQLVDQSIPFRLDGKEVRVGQGHGDWTAITQRKTAENPNGGQFSPKEYARFPMRQWKNSLDDPFAPGSKSPKQVVEDALNGKVADEEPWVLLPRQKIEEFASQINPTKGPIPDVLNAFGRVTNRAILATNPAWVLAQAVGEAIPIVLAHPEMAVKGAKARYEFHQWAKHNPEEAWAYQGVIGASPSSSAALRTPTDMRETYTTPDVFDLGAKALTRGRTARAAISIATLRTLGEFDSRRQNEYRTMTALMESDRQFRSFHKGLTSLFDEQAALSRRFRGKSRAEMLDWLTKTDEGKVHLQKIADHVDDVNGNWTAFTHLEQSFAPLVIFYPFLRYSLRWTLWTFPKSHPIAATAAYMMGQANSNQLEKLLGTKPNPLAYSYPVYEGVNGKAVLPGGSRISPGQSVFTNIAFEGNPSQIVGALNPVIGAGVTAATGTGPFGTQALGPRGWAAADQLLSLPGPMRVLLQRTNLDAQTIASKLGIGSPSPPSAFGKAMKQFDPLKDERSLLFPGIPQSAQRFRGEQKLIADETQKYKDPVPSPFTPQVIDAMKAADQGNWGPTKKLIKEHKLSQAAKDRITQAESPFFQDSGGAFGDNAIQALKLIQGGVFIPQTPAELRATASKKSTPFGVGAKSAPSSKSSTPFGL